MIRGRINLNDNLCPTGAAAYKSMSRPSTRGKSALSAAATALVALGSPHLAPVPAPTISPPESHPASAPPKSDVRGAEHEECGRNVIIAQDSVEADIIYDVRLPPPLPTRHNHNHATPTIAHPATSGIPPPGDRGEHRRDRGDHPGQRLAQRARRAPAKGPKTSPHEDLRTRS